MAHVIFCMPCCVCCVRGNRIKSVPSIDQTPRWQCWEPSNAHKIGGLGVGRNVNHHVLLLLPSKIKVSELIVSQNKFWVSISWVDTCAKLKWSALAVRLSCTAVQQRDGQSEEWIRIPANRAARHESQMDGNRWLALLGTQCIILINIVNMNMKIQQRWVIESRHVPSRKCRWNNVKVSTFLAWLRIDRESGRGDSVLHTRTWAMLLTQDTHIGSDLRLFPLLLDFLPVPWSDHRGFWLQLLPDTTSKSLESIERLTSARL